MAAPGRFAMGAVDEPDRNAERGRLSVARLLPAVATLADRAARRAGCADFPVLHCNPSCAVYGFM